MQTFVDVPYLERKFVGHCASITQIRFEPTAGQHLATSCMDTAVRIWDLRKCPATCTRFGDKHQQPVHALAWSHKGVLATSGQDRSVKIWQPQIHSRSATFAVHHLQTIYSVDFHPSGRQICTASADKTVKLWHLKGTRKYMGTLRGHTNWVRAAKFSPNGLLIASCGDDGSVRIYDARTQECVRCFKEPMSRDAVQQLDWHPSGSVLAAGFASQRVKIFDVAQAAAVQEHTAHAGAVLAVAFHPVGNFVFSGGEDGTVAILDILEGRKIFTLVGHVHAVVALDVANDGERFATGGADGQLLLWKWDVRQCHGKRLRARGSEEVLLNADKSGVTVDARSSNVYHANVAEQVQSARSVYGSLYEMEDGCREGGKFE